MDRHDLLLPLRLAGGWILVVGVAAFVRLTVMSKGSVAAIILGPIWCIWVAVHPIEADA